VIVVELASCTYIHPSFHEAVEPGIGERPSEALQRSRRPKSQMAYPLAELVAFHKNTDNLDDDALRNYRGLFYLGLVVGGDTYDLGEIAMYRGGLKVLTGRVAISDMGLLYMAGDGDTWAYVLEDNLGDSAVIEEWKMACRSCILSWNLDFML
jgi:hypothetical protein